MRAYPLLTYDPVRSVETFYIEFDQGCRHSSDKHNDGVEEHIFVLRGTLRLVLGDKIDNSLKRFTTVFPACGSGNSAIELSIEELEKYSGYTAWIDVCKGWNE